MLRRNFGRIANFSQVLCRHIISYDDITLYYESIILLCETLLPWQLALTAWNIMSSQEDAVTRHVITFISAHCTLKHFDLNLAMSTLYVLYF